MGRTRLSVRSEAAGLGGCRWRHRWARGAGMLAGPGAAGRLGWAGWLPPPPLLIHRSPQAEKGGAGCSQAVQGRVRRGRLRPRPGSRHYSPRTGWRSAHCCAGSGPERDSLQKNGLCPRHGGHLRSGGWAMQPLTEGPCQERRPAPGERRGVSGCPFVPWPLPLLSQPSACEATRPGAGLRAPPRLWRSPCRGWGEGGATPHWPLGHFASLSPPGTALCVGQPRGLGRRAPGDEEALPPRNMAFGDLSGPA